MPWQVHMQCRLVYNVSIRPHILFVFPDTRVGEVRTCNPSNWVNMSRRFLAFLRSHGREVLKANFVPRGSALSDMVSACTNALLFNVYAPPPIVLVSVDTLQIGN